MLQNSIAPRTEEAMSIKATVTSQSLAAKEQARIQGQVFMAKQFPRDMMDVMNRIESSCGRKSLAEISEYEYNRAGSMITGASIRLLECVAQCYGNISYSWKELVRDTENHRSTAVAYAWDLESNVYSEMEFEVPHYRDKKSGNQLLTSERDIYELIANQAARRVRRCLENVIPRDIVDQAREWCNETLKTQVDIQGGIDKAITTFSEEYGVKQTQIEKYFGMSRRAFTKNTYLSLRKIYASIRDGMSKVEDYFLPEEVEKDSAPKNSLVGDTKEKIGAPGELEAQPAQEPETETLNQPNLL